MNKRCEHLFEAIGLVDDRLVEEAADARRTATPWRRWLPLAACLVLVVGLGFSSLTVLFRGCSSSDTAASVDMAADTADTAGSDTTGSTGQSSTTTDAADGGETGGTADAGDSSASPGETPTDGAAESAPQETEAAAAGYVLPLTADADGLTAERTVTLSLADPDGVRVTDTYRVTNAGEARTVVFRYPELLAPEAPPAAVLVDGAAVSTSQSNGDWAAWLEESGEAAEADAGTLQLRWTEFSVELAAGETVTVTVERTLESAPEALTVWRDAGSRLDLTAVTVAVDGAAETSGLESDGTLLEAACTVVSAGG